MTPPKSKKPSTPWFQCEKCKANILHKDIDHHSSNCPPSVTQISHHFIKNGSLYGLLDIKAVEEIKGISNHDRNNLVFLSQSAIQLCNLAIGENAVVRDIEIKHPACARIVWPTAEKSSISVLLTKNGLDLSFEKTETNVSVSRITTPIKEARQITLTAVTNLKSLELSSEMQNRIHKLHVNRLLTEGNKIMVMFYGRLLKFQIKSIEASDVICSEGIQVSRNLEDEFDGLTINEDPLFYKVAEKTKWNLFRNEAVYQKEVNKTNLWAKIGGLDPEISELRDLMNSALGKFNAISRSTISRGVLLYGSSGTGKTLIANALAKESGVNIVSINMTTLYSSAGSTEDTVTKLFEDAVKHTPSIILIDEIDVFCPSRSSRVNDSEKRIMSNLLNLFDQINEADWEIFLLAMSNKADSIDPAFRRCGRLDREIEIPTPNPNGRLDILQKLLKDVPHSLSEDHVRETANSAHGFVGSDLVSLCSRAALHAAKRGDSGINFGDLKFALSRVRPSAMREVQIEVPNVKWNDIGGQDNLKLILRQAVEWPLKHAESFVRMGITPPRGVLMFGPPGCSKTMIAKALATESGLNFLSIKGPELFSKWVGESERAVREVFRKARQVAPSIIFFDEIDALGGERSSGSSTSVQERVLAQLLTELDGVTPLGDVTVLAATNRPDRIDKALLRPGRLDRIVHVPLPDIDTRREIFKLKLSKMPAVNVDLESLVKLTDHYSGAEVNAVCHEAAMKALEESLESQTVEMRHFEKALQMVIPRTPQSLLRVYEEYLKQ